MSKPKTYPSHVLEQALRDSGANVRPLWEMKGPPDTDVAWLVAYAVNGQVVIVQTYGARHGQPADWDGGWDAYVQASGSNSVADTIAAVKAHCEPA